MQDARETSNAVTLRHRIRGILWPLIVLIVCGGSSLLVWRSLVDQERAAAAVRLADRQADIQEQMRSEIAGAASALRRIADRWHAAGGTPHELWVADARSYLRDYPYVRALEWAEPDLVVRWVEPLEGNDRAMNLDLTFEQNRREALYTARDTGETIATTSIDLVEGGKGFILFCPIGTRADFDGLILGVFSIDTLFEHLTTPYNDHFATVVREAGNPIYQSAEISLIADSGLAGLPTPIEPLHESWAIQLIPTPLAVATHISALPHFVLAVGLLLTTSLVLLAIVLGGRHTAPSPPTHVYMVMRNERTIRIREWSFFFTAALMMLSPLLINRLEWRGNSELHMQMELVATLLAFFIGAVALAHFRANADTRFLFLGAGFLGVAFLDGYHAVVSSVWFAGAIASPSESLIPWSWNASRAYLALMMLAGWWVWRREWKSGHAAGVSVWAVCVGIGSLMLFTFALFAFVPLPVAYFPDQPIGRPEDLVAGALFIAALFAHISARKWKTEVVEYSIVLSLIVGAVVQVFLMPFSFGLFDRMFDAAHVFKIVSYACVLSGLLASTAHLFNRAKSAADELAAVNGRLTESSVLLQAQQAQLQGILDNTSAMIYVKDLEGGYLLVNKRYEQLFGVTNDFIRGKKDHILFPKEVADELRRMDLAVAEAGTVIEKEECIPYDDGDHTYISTKFPIYDESGELSAVAGISTDITEIKAIEAELIAARDTATEAEKTKAEFLANMCHEIRTPMNGIIGKLDLVVNTELNEEQRDCVETARLRADALLTLINDILDFSKIEAGAVTIEHIDFDVRSTVEDVADLLALNAINQNIELTSQVSGAVPQVVSGDPGRIRQILINLIGNAVKFTRDGDVVVSVSVTEETELGVVLKFEVSDTGIGIPTDRLDSIFDKFSQADSSTTREYGGTGLGLSICNSLTDLMGGAIGVESEEGHGARFWFTVPVKRRDAIVPAPVVAVIPLDGMKVLVVDDNKTNRRVLREEVTQFGFECETASSAPEALDRLRHAGRAGRPFDLALLDHQMPEMGGEDLGRAIKEDAAIAGVPLIMLTSHGQRGDAARFEQMGFAGYLQKPVKPNLLFDCMMAVFGQAEEDDGAPRQFITQHTLHEARRLDTASILLAEDNLVNQKVAQAILKKLGHRCDIAHNGSEAVAAIRKTQYDIVLMDCQMPEMDGYEATAKIRALDSERRYTTIIAMTANVMKGEREKCLEAGMDDYIAKPIKPDILAEAIARNLLRRRSEERTAR